MGLLLSFHVTCGHPTQFDLAPGELARTASSNAMQKGRNMLSSGG
jgi:hypothetical protein